MYGACANPAKTPPQPYYTEFVTKAADPRVALSSARVAVLRALRELGGFRTVKELAGELDQHPNTVREHLDALVKADFVLAESSKPEGRGRPAIRYRANPARGSRERAYVDLTNELARAVGKLPDAERAAMALGRDWGGRLINEDPDALSDGVLGWLRRQGFAPEQSGEVIVLRQCPFIEAARQQPGVICAIHLGVLEEYVARSGKSQPMVLTPAFEERCCRLQMGPERRIEFSTTS